MGASGASAAGGASLVSIGLDAYSSILKSEGVANANEFQAEKLENAAKYGELKAVQTNAHMTRSLNTTLGNIQAVRAAANADPTSPTGAVILDNQATLGNEQKGVVVNSILQQARQDNADAAYYRSAAEDALFAGRIGAAAGVAKGLASIGRPG